MSGEDIAAFAEIAGLQLDSHQIQWLADTFAVDAEGRWKSRDVQSTRRSGNFTFMATRVLIGLFLLDEPRIVWASANGRDAHTDFERIARLIKAVPALDTQVHRYSAVNGGQRIELKSGSWLCFVNWGSPGYRGMTADTLLIDGAHGLTDRHRLEFFPALAASDNPQVWYAE